MPTGGHVPATRKIVINQDHQPQKCRNNVISTCKYDALTFLPRFLYEQFRRYSNIFFLCIVLLQQINGISPTGRYTTLVPFVIILTVSALKEIFEDIKRRTSDTKVNNFPTHVLRNGSFTEIKWKEVRVGHIIRVDCDQLFPADLLIVASSEPQGMAYIETSNLDGETNLKIKQALDNTAKMTSSNSIQELTGARIECELPSRNVNEFSGNLIYKDDTRHFGMDQLLLRGARLKNTPWIYGAVIYSGHDSKLLMNSKSAPLKSGTIDRMTNRRIIVLFVVLVSLALVSAAGQQIWNAYNLEQSWYLNPIMKGQGNNFTGFIMNAITFFILYNNLIPISLQVTLEMVRFFQAYFINWDLQMYDERTDSRAIARTSNLNEELGLVKFVMSDKTGTLTRNVMKFKRATVAGKKYGDNSGEEFEDDHLMADAKSNAEEAVDIRELLTMMAVCHTVVPEKKDDEIIYQSSSPDEGALVRGAASQGFVFHTRQPQRVVIKMFDEDLPFDILDVIEFTSDRKRMSVIVKDGQGKIKLYCKGADTMIFDRVDPDSKQTVDFVKDSLEEYATFGYRTLCFAKKDISESEYNQWSPEYKKAGVMIEGRKKALEEAAERIEKNMKLVGATAIEDKLQEYVPETIQALMAADIHVWMLTGDKRETAINIAHSCALVNQNTELLIVDKTTYDDTYHKLIQFVDRAKQLEEQKREFAMVIDGKSLVHALTGEARDYFGQLALMCHSVVCCRMSPMQKAEVVDMVRRLGDHVVLAIGDGANDVAMIQAANVGIGISGEEGLQAASASDYAIAQFHFLRRLLLVHGAWDYDRSVKVILYSFYKNICLYIIELWFAFFSAWSGQTIFERWTIGMFNVIFTAWPPLIIGLFDRPINDEQMMRFPALYYSFQKRAFTMDKFAGWIGVAIYHSLLLYFLTYFFLDEQVVWSNGRVGGWLMLGNSTYTFVVITVCLKAILETDSWTWISGFFCAISIASWFVLVWVYNEVFPTVERIGADMAGMFWIMCSSPTFWLALIFIPTTTLLADLCIKSLKATVAPTPREQAVRMQKRHGFERLISIRLSSYQSTSAAPILRRDRESRHSDSSLALQDATRLTAHSEASIALRELTRYGFAFSQAEEGPMEQTELINVDSTMDKPSGL
ncbi:unnamed protein product, partial [Mesorhabditis spiculigera]